MGKSSKSDFRQLDFISESQKCTFCQTTEIDELKYGPVYMHKNIVTHYYCLLLSSNMEQNGRDSDGILGFLASDITKEVRRGSKLYCTYCRARGSTLGCAIPKCKVVFHLPCGLKHGTLHQFFGEFKSFCNKHRPVQKISENILAESSVGAMCGICYEKVIPRPVHDTLWAPCCQKSAFFHRDCVQRLATSAGYFFKCPLCNNVDTFQQAMKEFGIFIPEQDASWERVPNAYQDLLVRHDSCDNPSCKCPSGRKTNIQGTRWELILCKFCGSQGVHIGCGRLKWKSPEFGCESCSGNSTEDNMNVQGDRHRLAPATSPGNVTNRGVERSRQRARSVSSDDSLQMTLSNRRRRVASPRSSPSSSSSPSPERERRTPTPEHRKHRTVSPEHRKRRAPSPEHRKHRAPSPEHRKHRAPSPEHRKHRATSPEHRKHRATLPEHRRSTHDRVKPKRETKQYKSKAIVIDSSDEDLEVVDNPNVSGCLKTRDGSTIQVVSVVGGQNKLRVEGDIRVLESDDLAIVDTNLKFPKVQVPSPPPLKEVVYSLPPPPVFQPQPSTSASVPSPYNPAQSYVLVDPNTYRAQDLPPGAVLYRSIQPIVNLPPQQPVPQQLGSSSDADAKYSDFSKYRDWSRNHFNPQYLQIQEISNNVQCDRVGQRRRGHNHNRLNPTVLLCPLYFRINNRCFEICVRERQKLIFTQRNPSPLTSKISKKVKKSSKQDIEKNFGKKIKTETKLKLSRSLFCISSSTSSKKESTLPFDFKMKLQTTNKSIVTTSNLVPSSSGGDKFRTKIKKHKKPCGKIVKTSTSNKLKKSPLLSSVNCKNIEQYLIQVNKTSSLKAHCSLKKENLQNEEELENSIEFSSNCSNTEILTVTSPADSNNESESKILLFTPNDNLPTTNQETDVITQSLVDTSATPTTYEPHLFASSPTDNPPIKEEIELIQLLDTNGKMLSTNYSQPQKISKVLPSKSNVNQLLTNEEGGRISQPLGDSSAAITTNEQSNLASSLKYNSAFHEEIKCLQLIDTNTVDENYLSTKERSINNNKKSNNSVVKPVQEKKNTKKRISEQNYFKPKKIKLLHENNTKHTGDPKRKKHTYIKSKISINKLITIDKYFAKLKKEFDASSLIASGQSSDTSLEEKDDSEHPVENNDAPKSFFQLSSPAKVIEMARSVARLFD